MRRKLSLGCDFHLSYDNMQDVLANPTRYVIADTRYMLVEFSNYSVPRADHRLLSQAGGSRHYSGDHAS